MKYKVNKAKCIGCQVCVASCPGATKMGEDGKAEIIDQEKLEKCGGESVCPMGAIEKVSNGEKTEQLRTSSPLSPVPPPYGPPPPGGRGLGKGRGPGWSRGMGRRWRGGR